MVEAAEADVVGPAVAAHDPDALLAPGSRRAGASRARLRARRCRRALARSAATRSRCAAMPASLDWSASRSSPHEVVADARRRGRCSRRARLRRVRVEGQADAQAELGVVLEERVGPGRARGRRGSMRVGRGGQVAAVDRRAAGGVGDQRAVAEELGQELEVRRLAAARAGARVLEERLQELRALDVELARVARSSSGRSRKNA